MNIFIDMSIPIKEQFKTLGLCYPVKKSSGKYGLRNSTLLDEDTEQKAEQRTIEYLVAHNIIGVK